LAETEQEAALQGLAKAYREFLSLTQLCAA